VRSRRSLLVVLVGLLLTAGVTEVMSPQLTRYELSRRLDRLVLQATAPDGSGVVDIGELDQFAWDRLYVFTPYTPHTTVDAALGFEWTKVHEIDIERRDDINLLVLARGRFVAAYLELPRSRLDFAHIADDHKFTPSSAQFLTHTESGSQVVLLTPVAPSRTHQTLIAPPVASFAPNCPSLLWESWIDGHWWAERRTSASDAQQLIFLAPISHALALPTGSHRPRSPSGS
jgi:hypothetical protein